MVFKLPSTSRAVTAAVATVALVIGFGGSIGKAFAHDHEDGWEEHGEHEEAEERQEAHERHEAEEAREAWQRQEWQERQQYAQPYGYYGYSRPRVIYQPRGYAYSYGPQSFYQGGSSLSFSFGGF
jgi:hypothetical protein